MKNQKGQALIESVLATPLLLMCFIGLLYLAYHSAIFFYVSYQLEEALICMTGRNSSRICQDEFRSGLKRVLLFNEKFKLDFRDSGNLRNARVSIQTLRSIDIELKMAKKLEDL